MSRLRVIIEIIDYLEKPELLKQTKNCKILYLTNALSNPIAAFSCQSFHFQFQEMFQ